MRNRVELPSVDIRTQPIEAPPRVGKGSKGFTEHDTGEFPQGQSDPSSGASISGALRRSVFKTVYTLGALVGLNFAKDQLSQKVAGLAKPEDTSADPKPKSLKTFMGVGFADAAELPNSVRAPDPISSPVTYVLQDLSTALDLRGPSDVCFDLENLAQDVARQMDVARPALKEYQAVSGEELADFGNKHANLVRQARLIDALESGGAQLGVHVPMPEGVRTQQVHALLRSKAPEVYEKWSELGQVYKAYKGSTPFLQTESAQKLLAEIDSSIAKAFDGNTFEGLRATPQMRAWLEGIHQKNGYLMVRSTGAEDTKESANAGGNLSEAYVAPDEQSVSKALGNVVRSYFSVGSLQNRINAGRNPFAEELKLAVTMQELIGEEVGGTSETSGIPRSLVMFTNEPIWVGGEEFRVMRLSAAYGHGEGVVGNQGIAGDTILVLNSLTNPGELHIIYENQDKPSRLAPVRGDDGHVTLQQIPNPVEIRRARVFNAQEIARLFQWGIVGESYFGGPTDMEIVVRGDMVYPVQARPVNRPALLPNYVDLTKTGGVGVETMRANAFVPGKGSVVEITDPDQVLIADTLEAAEKVFIKGQHQVVIVSQKEPANSHPVVNFSSMGMICLAVPIDRREQLGSWLEQLGDKSIAVCPQSGALYLIDKDDAQALTSSGFVAHPAQTTRSFELPEPLVLSLTRTREVPKELEDLLMSVNTASTAEEALQNLQKLRASTWNQEFRQRRLELEKHVAAMRIKPKEVLKILEAAKQLEEEVGRTFSEAELALKSGRGRLRLLFQTKYLGGLLFERQSEALNQFSVATINAALDAASEIATYQAGLSHEAQFADLLLEGQRTPDASVYPLWKEFLTKLEALPPAQTEAFREMMAELKSSGEMALWMTLFFRNGYANKDVSGALTLFGTHLPNEDKPAVKKMNTELDKCRLFRMTMNDIAEPAKFDQTLAGLSKRAKAMKAELLGSGGGVVLSSIRLRLMDEFVDLYDSAIKAMKMSQHYTDSEKAEKFKQMLEPYVAMMEDWAKNLVGAELVPVGASWGLDRYLNWFKENFGEKTATPAELRPSRDFSVAAAKLGSASAAAAFERHYPQTLEDYFTLAHQNLLAAIGHMNAKSSGLDALSQGELKPLADMMESVEKLSVGRTGEFKPVRIGSKVSEDTVSIQYRVPLQNHAAAIELLHHRDTGKTEFKVSFLGDARERWGQIRFLAETLSTSGQAKMAGAPHANAQGLEYSFEATPQSMALLLEEFKFATDVTFGKPTTAVAEYATQHGRSAAAFVDTAFGLLRQPDESSKQVAFALLASSIENGELSESQIQRISDAAMAELRDSEQARADSGWIARNILLSIARKKGDFSGLLELSKRLPAVQADYLLAELVREGHGIDEAIEIMKEIPLNRGGFHGLLSALFGSTSGQAKLIDLALDIVRESDADKQQKGLIIFRALNNDISINGAFEIAEKLAVESEDSRVQVEALYALQSMASIAEERRDPVKNILIGLSESSESSDVQCAILNVFSNQPEGLDIAFRFARDVNPIVQRAALDYIERSNLSDLQRKQSVDLILELAEDPHETILPSLSYLIGAVSRTDEGFQAVAPIAQRLVLSSWGDNEFLKIRLLRLLGSKQKLTDKIVKSIEESVMDSTQSNWSRQELIEILLDGDKASGKMVDEAVKLVSSAPRNFMGLLTRLIRKVESPQMVIEAAIQIVLDPVILSYERMQLLNELVSRFPEDPKILEGVSKILADTSIYSYAKEQFLKGLLDKKPVSLGVIRLIEKILQEVSMSFYYKRNVINSLIEAGHVSIGIVRVAHEMLRSSHEQHLGVEIIGKISEHTVLDSDVLNEILEAVSSANLYQYKKIEIYQDLIEKKHVVPRLIVDVFGMEDVYDRKKLIAPLRSALEGGNVRFEQLTPDQFRRIINLAFESTGPFREIGQKALSLVLQNPDLIKQLLGKGECVSEVTKLANQLVASQTGWTNLITGVQTEELQKALGLFEQLVAHGYAIPEATAAGKILSSNSDAEVTARAKKLLSKIKQSNHPESGL